ncbi:MAG: DUF805 domain-containing protein [Alphaproteobacteria bacterium]
MFRELLKAGERYRQFVADNPDLPVVNQTGTGFLEHNEERLLELMPDMAAIALGMSAITVLFVLLIAAATARRLHDRGKSGWWGVAMMPYLLVGLGTAFLDPRQLIELETIILIGWAVSGVFFSGLLIYLIVQLASRGNHGENKFGQVPQA